MYVYAISDGNGKIKIGYSDDPTGRVRQLQTGNAHELTLTHSIWCGERAPIIEKKLHQELGHWRSKGEWFTLSESQARNMLDFAIIRWLDDPLVD